MSARPCGQNGFTLLEMAIALVLMSMASVLVAGSFEPWLAYRQENLTDVRMQTLAAAIAAAYLSDPRREEGDNAAELALRGGILGDRMAVDGRTVAILDARRASGGVHDGEDGFNRPFAILVSPRQTRQFDGVALSYHVVAVVSGGRNGHIEAATRLDPASGLLSLAGDDRGIVVDGFAIERALAEESLTRLQRVADAYQAYFRLRFLSDVRRDVAVDYFASACDGSAYADRWDAAGTDAMPSGCSEGVELVEASTRLLGLSDRDRLDAWGQPVRIDNASVAVRHPDNPDLAMTLPPYSARVFTVLPGGGQLPVGVLGSY